jgi:hypothetical protein
MLEGGIRARNRGSAQKYRTPNSDPDWQRYALEALIVAGLIYLIICSSSFPMSSRTSR